MSWFKKNKAPKPKIDSSESFNIPDNIWSKCPSCSSVIYSKELRRNSGVCLKCNYHFRLKAKDRIRILVDRHSFIEMDQDLKTNDPLNFKALTKYKDSIKKAQKKTGLNDCIVSGEAKIKGVSVVLGVFDFFFMGGSMGTVAGEKLTRVVEKGIAEKKPVIIFSASGGARMHEGIFSLMQMAKVSAALNKLSKSSVPYISVLTDPTTGGVAASFAMLGDVNIAEPRALIGFAGPRVIEGTIRQKLPEGFQRSEFLLEHGMIDLIVERNEMRDKLSNILINFGFDS